MGSWEGFLEEGALKDSMGTGREEAREAVQGRGRQLQSTRLVGSKAAVCVEGRAPGAQRRET